MTLAEAEAALYALLQEHWTQTPLAWRNVDPRNYAGPSQPLLPDGDADYLSIQVDIFSATTVTVPGSCIRYAGQLVAGICVKESTGTRQAKQYLTEVCALAENSRIVSSDGNVRLSTLSNMVDYFLDNGWYVLEATFPLYFERYLTPARITVGV